jgi:DNA-binding transcriptional MocR family regulator
MLDPPPMPSVQAVAPAAPAALLRDGEVTLAEQLARRFAERIGQRLLPPGARLPSVRECARRHQVSPTTVVAAYDRLLAQGLVEARRQRGFFVRERREGRSSGAASARPPAPGARPPPVDATALIRSMFHRGDGRSDPGMGTLPADWVDLPLLHGALRRAMGTDRGAGVYGEPAGDPGLREALAARLADLGVRADAAQIVTTVGASQALDLVARTLLQPGDAVLVDEPGWPVEYARLTQLGLRLLPVPRGDGGPDLERLRHLLQTQRPRLYVTVSVLHNPTGHSLSAAAAHALLKLADEHDLTLVEDDTYAWLAPEHAPRLCALDGLQRTVYVSGFSKVLTPDWRVGYVAAPPALVERLVDLKLLTSLSTPSLPERAVAWCLGQGLLRRHADRIGARLDAARARTVALAEQAGCRFAAPPRGLFGWVDVGIDTQRLAEVMLDQGWLIAPGALFHAVARPSSLMRINFATSQDPRFWHAVAAARRARTAPRP